MTIGVDGNEANVEKRVGSGQFAFELIKEFSRISQYSSSEAKRSREVSSYSSRQARTISFSVYLKEKPRVDFPKETANFKYLVFGPKKFWTQFALPAKLLTGEKPDVFFSPSHYGPRFSKIPTVITIFDLSYIHFPELFRKNDLYQLTNWTARSAKKAKAIITISNFSKDDIVKNYKVDPKNVTVAYPGYDQKLFKPQGQKAIESIKKKYKIKGDYIFFLGTIQPRKNLIRLLDAFESVNRELRTDNLQLVISGKKGWLYDEFFDKVKTMKDKVVVIDFAAEKDLPALFSGAKAFVLPSLYEGFGIPVIEAQACGCPVIVSNVSSLPEIVTLPSVIHASSSVIPAKAGIDNKILDQVENDKRLSAILIDPESIQSISDGIKRVMTDEKLRQELVKKGYQNIKRFSWQKCAKEVLGALSKVASNSDL